MAKKNVQGGPIVDTAKKMISKIFKGINSCFNSLASNGWTKSSEEDIEEDGVAGKLFKFKTGSGNVVEVKLFGVESHPGNYIIRIAHDGGKDVWESDNLIPNDKVAEKITAYADKYDLGAVEDEYDDEDDDLGDDSEGDDEDSTDLNSTAAGSSIQVTLKRVTASNGVSDIHLCAVNASTCAHPMSVIKDVLADDDFVAEITSKPVSYDIMVDTDGYDVQQTDTVDTSGTYLEMLRATFQCYYNIESIRWGAMGEQRSELIRTVESIQWSIQYKIGNLAQLCVEKTGIVPNMLNMQYTPIDVSSGVEFNRGIALAKQQLDELIQVLECYYVNLDHDVQTATDGFIRELRDQSDYVLDRTLMGNNEIKIACLDTCS